MSTSTYLSSACSHEILTKDEETTLLAMVREGSPEALDKLIRCNLKFVIRIAIKYKKHLGDYSFAFDDLIQEGNIGLITAIQKFDPSKNCRLTTYASYWIRAKISKKLRQITTPRDIPILDAQISKDRGNNLTKKENLEDVQEDFICLNNADQSLEIQNIIKAADQCLKPVENHVFYHRMLVLSPKTNEALGKELGCTGETVRLICLRAIQKIRRHLGVTN